MFCDEHKITVKAGKGGDGCSSFRREKFIAKGGPNGGDGGNGGDVIIKVNSNHNTLSHLVHKRIFKANKGGFGMGKNMHGKNAEHLIIEVPKGTIVWNADKSEKIADLNNAKDKLVIAKGGIGGMGNARFANSTNQAPRFAEWGEPGEEKEIVLELKLVADVGIIGFPSAGKSTLISVISNAKPKIAAYHFTTLTPNLGVVKYHSHNFVVADIPGLIEGASDGKGLGHQFLKHISRTKLLLHLIDASEEDPDNRFRTINKELKKFDKKLSELPQIIVLNKIDLLDEKTLKKQITKLKKASKTAPIFTISAVTHTNLPDILSEISKQLTKLNKKAAETPEIEEKVIPILKPHLQQVKFKIEKIVKEEERKVFHLKGRRIEQIAVMTNMTSREGQERIYYYLNKSGIQKALHGKKAKHGDMVEINGKRIPYRP